jgi:DNA-binding MarR family transcriptional regulator
MPTPVQIGEALARLIMALGFCEDLALKPTYEDLARATGRSLSRIRSIVSEAEAKGLKLLEVRPRKDGKIELSLSPKGKEVYESLLNAVRCASGQPQAPQDAVKRLDRLLYADRSAKKPLGSCTVTIDAVVPALRIPEVMERLKESKEVGSRILSGLASELATAVEQASYGYISSVGYNELAKTVINVPLRITRVLEVSLPPHIERTLMLLDRIKESLKGISIWPGEAAARSVYGYAREADALGLVRLIGDRAQGAALEPRLGTGLEVIDRVAEVGFDVLAVNPSRAWIPALFVYGDATLQFPTVEELLDCRTKLLNILKDVVGYERCRKWVEHALGIKKHLPKTPALAQDATYDTFGVLRVVRLGDEKRVISFTAARRIARKDVPGGSFNEVLSIAEKKVENVVKVSGIYGELLKRISKEGFLSADQLIREARKTIEDHKAEVTAEAAIRELERHGFIQATALGYYSAWTLTPIHEHADETGRALLAWIAKEVLTPERREVMNKIIEILIGKGEVDVAEVVGDARTLASVLKRLWLLERAGLVSSPDGATTIKVLGGKRRKLLETAYLGFHLGLKIPQMSVEESNREPDLGEIIVARTSKQQD